MRPKGKNGKSKKKWGQSKLDPEEATTRRSQRKSKSRSAPHNGATAPTDLQLRQAVEGDNSRTIFDIEADGNCLFRSLSDQLYHDMGAKHVEVRQDICDFLEGHQEEFSVFLVLDDDDASDEDGKDFDTYVYNMRQDGAWGGNVELVAAARMYRRNITVFSAGLDALTISHGCEKVSAAGPDLLVSYHDNDHYNSVRNNNAKRPPPAPIKTYQKKYHDLDEILVDGEDEDGDTTESDDVGGPSRMDVDCIDRAEESVEAEPIVVKRGQCPCGSGKKLRKCCKSRAKKKAAAKSKDETETESDYCEPDMDGEFRVLHI